MNRIRLKSLPLLLIAGCLSLTFSKPAWAQPVLSLPAGSVPSCPVAAGPCVTINPTSAPRTAAAYFLVNFKGLPSGLSIGNTLTYTGWCADMWAAFSPTETYKLYNTYFPPSDSAWVNWGAINWILNNKPTSIVGDNPLYGPADNLQYVVQHVIWNVITNGNSFAGDPALDTIANSLYKTALLHGNFIPAPGQVVAVLLHVDGITGVEMANNATQDIIFEVIVPTTAGSYTTVTQGGWGAAPHGNNSGAILLANFANVYPTGVTIGGNFTLTFTSAAAIEAFLPQGGTPAQLTATSTDATSSPAGVFAGQVLALQLNLDFSTAGVFKPGLANLKLQSGPLAGQTVAYVLAMANSVLGGGSLPAGLTLSQLNDAADAINQAFDSGSTGFLK
jgi:hypothetical protein